MMKAQTCIFLLVLVTQSLAQISVVPTRFTSIPGGRATFTCSGSALGGGDSIIGIGWLLNNRPLEMLGLENVTSSFLSEVSVGLLTFSSISQDLNMTNIMCIAYLASGRVVISGDTATLLVQGLLTAVDSISVTTSNSTFSITWESPFTLDINGVDPDITGYCVDVINSTSSMTIHSECGITVTTYTYPVPPDANCHRYNCTVRPVNAVGVGEPTTVTLVAVEASPCVLGTLRVPSIKSPDDFSYELNMSGPVCSCKVPYLLNLDTGEKFSLNSTDTAVHAYDNSTITITFNRSQVTDNHHYNVTVEAANSAGESSSSIVISTHDITDVSIATNGTEVTIETEYFEGSNATGALYEFIYISDSGVDFTRSVSVALDRETPDDYEVPFSLSSGLYRVFVYDIEENGILSSGVGYPAVTDEVDLSGDTTEPGFMPVFQELENCTSNVSTYLVITVECTYSNNSLATGFQMIVQQGDPDRVHSVC